MTLNFSIPAMRYFFGPLFPLSMPCKRRPNSLQYDFSHSCLYLGCRRSWRYSMVLPVSGSKTSITRWSSDVSGVHHSASNSFGNFRWAACAGVTVRACVICNHVHLAMGCSCFWYWERVRRPTGSWSGYFLGFTLGAGAGTLSCMCT